MLYKVTFIAMVFSQDVALKAFYDEKWTCPFQSHQHIYLHYITLRSFQNTNISFHAFIAVSLSILFKTTIIKSFDFLVQYCKLNINN